MPGAGAAVAVVLLDSLLPLLGRQLAPFAFQLFALRGRQALEALEAAVHALAFCRRHLAEPVLVGARLTALLRRHLLPVDDALADLLAALGWQRGPVPGAVQQVRLLAWRQLIPFVLERRQHLALARCQAVPRGACRRVRARRWRRGRLRAQRRGRDPEQGGKQQRQEGRQRLVHGVSVRSGAGRWRRARRRNRGSGTGPDRPARRRAAARCPRPAGRCWPPGSPMARACAAAVAKPSLPPTPWPPARRWGSASAPPDAAVRLTAAALRDGRRAASRHSLCARRSIGSCSCSGEFIANPPVGRAADAWRATDGFSRCLRRSPWRVRSPPRQALPACAG